MAEVFEGEGEGTVKFTEDLFDEMQKAMGKLVRSYGIGENDLRGLLDVITQLWELLDATNGKCEQFENQKKDLEEIWNEEKEKRRQTEKRKAELENRFDEERYQWQSERQELQRDRVGLVTRIKQLEGRNKELISDLDRQSEKFEQDQKLRDDLVEQYKKQYEIAKTSTLKRKKNKKQTPGYHDYSTGGEHITTPPYSTSSNPLGKNPAMGEATEGPESLPTNNDFEVLDEMSDPSADASSRCKRQLPSKNKVSLRTELKHPKGVGGVQRQIPETFEYEQDEERYYEMETQEELLTSGPEILVVPTVAEVDMLKRQQQESRDKISDLQRKVEVLREDKEELESENAQLVVDVEQFRMVIEDYQYQLAMLRQERDEILESYLDQPFDVYCVTKKELHEVLKKLHDTQMEMQKQSEEKQSLVTELNNARRKKRSTWKKFAKRFRAVFHKGGTNSGGSSKNEEYEILNDPTITSYQIPPEAPFTPKSPETIKAMESFHVSKGWLLTQNGPTQSTLPSLYCQVMLKEYHVTDAISCMCLGRVYHTTQPLLPRRASLLPLAARTARGRLCAEVWVGSNEGATTFLEIIDVLSKRVIDRFLVRGSKIVCMESVPGTLPKPRVPSSSSAGGGTGSRQASLSKDTVTSKQQIFEESLDLFASDDQELQKQQQRKRKDSNGGKSEQDLRLYYKSRLQGRKMEARNDMNRSTDITDDMPGSFEKPSSFDKFSSSFDKPSSFDSSGSSSERLKRSEKLSSKTHKSHTVDLPADNSLASEIQRENVGGNTSMQTKTNLFTTTQYRYGSDMRGGEGSQEDSVEVFTDDEGDGWQTSTPVKTDSSPQPEELLMWVAPDTNCIHLYNASGYSDHRPLRTLNLPSQPSCIRYIPGKVCVGLCDSRMIVYHQETIVSGGIWDIENPSYIELPKLIPENPLPVKDIKLIRKKLWVTTGSFLTLLDPDTLMSQGSKFLDARQSQPNKLLPLQEVVLASTVKGSNIYLLDPDRAEVVKKINISHASLILDNFLDLNSVNVTNLIKDDSNVYISTSAGKIFALPLMCFSIEGDYEDRFIKQVSMPDPNDVTSASYPPSSGGSMDHPLFKCTASSLLTHREGSIRGLVHIPLPENITMPMLSTSNLNLSSRSLGLLNASSMPSLLSDSPPLQRSMFGGTSNVTHSVYRSLLVSCGKGFVNYLSESSKFEGSTALREKNEAFQVMVWGFEKPQSTILSNNGGIDQASAIESINEYSY